MREIRRILVANRGEMAVRIMRTVKRMGLQSVAVFSDADRHANHVRIADHGRHIGPAPASESYLSVPRILAAARDAGADAIHPGYGFLSENADFADACRAAGLVFIGPTPEAIRAMGSKSGAKALMAQAGVPLVPGYHGAEQSDEALQAAADAMGYPVLVKASAGGGGRGMRIVRGASELTEALASARREARAAFGDDRLLLERYMEHARHIEVQVFGDGHGNLVHLFERDCSVQRRYQKVIEEAPAPGLSESLRERLHDAALKAARAVGYVNAGTVEFIVSGEDAYFMEMNTRLQVEHPVTEAITGLDLVEWQIRVARGEPLPLAQEAIACTGHAIEARLCAEDPRRDFLPQSGSFEQFDVPEDSESVRVDWTGDLEVPPYYDSLLAKIVCRGGDRASAIDELAQALDETVTQGLSTNRRFLERLLAHPAFRAGPVETGFIAEHLTALAPDPEPADALALGVAAVAVLADRLDNREHHFPRSPWEDWAGWRVNLAGGHIVRLDAGGARHETVLQPHGTRASDFPWPGKVDILVDGEALPTLGWSSTFEPSLQSYTTPSGRFHAFTVVRNGRVWVQFQRWGADSLPDEDAVFDIADPRAAPAGAAAGGGHLLAPMPGTVAAVAVSAGETVTAGQTLVVVEAMKMEHAVKAPHDGKVLRVDCKVGDLVREGAELVALEALP